MGINTEHRPLARGGITSPNEVPSLGVEVVGSTP